VQLGEVQRTLRLSATNDLVIVTDENSSLSLVERAEAGPSSFIRVSGGGSEALGFRQVGARGAQVYPGWGLESRLDVYPSIRNGAPALPIRYPKFTAPLRGNPTVKVSYVSSPERCPRCGGTFVENDWRFDPRGEVITIQDEDLLYQACLKAVLTVRGSNPFHPGYGSTVSSRIGSKALGASAALVREDVQRALQQVRSLQKRQRQYQPVTNRELLFSIQSVDVRTSEFDPTVFFLEVTVRNGSQKPVSLSTVFSVPGAVALAGAAGKPLGLETTGLTGSASLADFGL